jgi:hypothetical protein
MTGCKSAASGGAAGFENVITIKAKMIPTTIPGKIIRKRFRILVGYNNDKFVGHV